jgi:hypothetical protein
MSKDLQAIRIVHLGWEILALFAQKTGWSFHCHEIESDDMLSSDHTYSNSDHCIQEAKQAIERIQSTTTLTQFFERLLREQHINGDEYALALTLLGQLGR